MIYPHFIEIDEVQPGMDRQIIKTSVNIDQIVKIQGPCIYLTNSERNCIVADESYDEILALMVEAGTCFVKKDPRIDYHPITWAELTEMVGEPVWAENQQKWFLVAQYDEESKEITLRGATTELYKSTIAYTEQMLIAKPLYRMKVFS